MKRGKEAARVYQYGSTMKAPLTDYIRQQLYLQVEFWNALVEFDRIVTAHYWRVVDSADDRIAPFLKKIEAISRGSGEKIRHHYPKRF